MRDCRKDRKPPYAERHVRWCERSHGELIPMLLLDRSKSTSVNSRKRATTSSFILLTSVVYLYLSAAHSCHPSSPISQSLTPRPLQYAIAQKECSTLQLARLDSVQWPQCNDVLVHHSIPPPVVRADTPPSRSSSDVDGLVAGSPALWR